MRDAYLDNILKKGYENRDKFSKLARYVVKHDVTPLAGDTLSLTARRRIAEAMSIDMSVGAELVKNKYIVTGMIIGSIITIVVMNSKKEIET